MNRLLRATTKPMWRPGLDIATVRAHTAKMERRLVRKLPPIPTEAVNVAGVPATWYGPPERAQTGTLLYLHGGAWCLHLPRIYARFATVLSDLTGMRVLLPDYRLAPEHKFPAGVDDCFAVYRWLLDQGHRERPFALAGDSAGGSLSLVTMMRARDALLPLPDCAVLLSPSTDITLTGPSWQYNSQVDPMFSLEAGPLLADIYCPGQDHGNPQLSPLFGNWNGLPPLLFHAGSTEMLLDDSVRAQDRAVQAGVAAEIEVYYALPHVWHMMSLLPEARVATQRVTDFIVRQSLRRAA
jgi:acetyl esterase/lipase